MKTFLTSMAALAGKLTMLGIALLVTNIAFDGGVVEVLQNGALGAVLLIALIGAYLGSD